MSVTQQALAIGRGLAAPRSWRRAWFGELHGVIHAAGIGGGLAITALMTGLLKVSQHRSQAISLAVTALPVTLPAALFYVQQGTALPWATIAALIIGLWVGTGLGARLANLVSPDKLRVALVIVIAAIAAFMAFKAWA